jgi:hypothetical protein
MNMVVLTESQLRAAVAVAEAQHMQSEWVRCAANCQKGSPEYVQAIDRVVAGYSHIADVVGAWSKVRPQNGTGEVRSVETLERIVGDHTDGGTETASRSRDTMLVEILREFRGLTARDGVA